MPAKVRMAVWCLCICADVFTVCPAQCCCTCQQPATLRNSLVRTALPLCSMQAYAGLAQLDRSSLASVHACFMSGMCWPVPDACLRPLAALPLSLQVPPAVPLASTPTRAARSPASSAPQAVPQQTCRTARGLSLTATSGQALVLSTAPPTPLMPSTPTPVP
jgi:hypothetical protein